MLVTQVETIAPIRNVLKKAKPVDMVARAFDFGWKLAAVSRAIEARPRSAVLIAIPAIIRRGQPA